MAILPVKFRQQIAYYENGPSKATDQYSYLLLHGLGNSMDFWISVAPPLAKHRRTIAIDLPGFGRSETPENGFTLEHITEAISNFCDQIDIRNCILVAHSLGAFIALDLANRAAARFNRLILVDGTLTRATEIIQHPALIVTRPVLSFYVATQFVGGMCPLGGSLSRVISRNRLIRDLVLWPYVANPRLLNSGALAAALANNGGLNVLKVLFEAHAVRYDTLMRSTPQPVDLIWGAKDHLINEIDIEAARSNMQVVRQEKIAGVGHWPMLEQPEILTQFLLAARGE
jgi:pimeloyl-ACP methyl ester carboxylesterase